jgi:hypothetical protein
MMNWKGRGSGRGLILRQYFGMCLEGLWKTTKNVSQDSRFTGRDLNRGPPEYETCYPLSLDVRFSGFTHNDYDVF